MGILLVVMAMLALLFGALAGKMGAIASAGYAKNLRHDIFYKIQEFSFGNIDHFQSIKSRDQTDDRYYKCADGIYVYNPSFGQSTDHGCFVVDHDCDH